MFKVMISGNLGGDPEKRFSQDGKAILSMNVAVNTRRRAADGERRDHTDWVRVRTSGPRADALAERLTKGQRVWVVGNLEIGEYTSRDGEKRTSLDVWADEIEYSAPRTGDRATSNGADPRPASTAPATSGSEDLEDLESLPF